MEKENMTNNSTEMYSNEDVMELARQLADTIMKSDVYIKYSDANEELNKNPQMKVMVDELRRYNFELQNAEGVPNMYDEVVKMYDKYAYVREDVAANRFLRYEVSMCRMIQNMVRVLFDNIDFDMDFLDL